MGRLRRFVVVGLLVLDCVIKGVLFGSKMLICRLVLFDVLGELGEGN